MTDIIIRKEGHAGRITLNRPKALNALTWDMCLGIEAALDAWQSDADVALVMIDGAGDRAFCSGGDIAGMYASGLSKDYAYGQRFWRDEYRLNAKIAKYAKPIVTFLHGFTMGGGVGVGCHASHRIVCADSQIAMPECSIGLVPDVGGSLLLAKAPGHCGEFLGLSADRMDAGDAIYTGFADSYIPHDQWGTLKSSLIEFGDTNHILNVVCSAPASRLTHSQDEIDQYFGADTLAKIYQNFPLDPGPAVAHIRNKMDRNAPLAMACAVQIIQQVRRDPQIDTALAHEYRFTYRSVAQGDFIEGIRAAIIDRDRAPKWQHNSWADVPASEVSRMTQPLDDNALNLKENT
jgi:enoyl-CoA hydratase